MHDVKYQAWSMDAWKANTPEIRSRCGFCGIVMGTWCFRVEHLAEHFKGGNSMADWKGDWGFDKDVLDIVENGIAPYLIDEERKSKQPRQTPKKLPGSPKTFEDHNDNLLHAARQTIHRLDATKIVPEYSEDSWFRDLFLLSGPSETSPRIHRARPSGTELTDRHKLNDHEFSYLQCPKERALRVFAYRRQMLGLTPTDSELQVEACRILSSSSSISLSPPSTLPSAVKPSLSPVAATNWFKYLINTSRTWLVDFRRRASLPRSSEMAIEHIRSMDEKTMDNTIFCATRLEHELRGWVRIQRAERKRRGDADLQRQARIIIYGTDDPWNQTWADRGEYLERFKRVNGLLEDGQGAGVFDERVGNGEGMNFKDLTDDVVGVGFEEKGFSTRSLHWDLELQQMGMGMSSQSFQTPQQQPVMFQQNQGCVPFNETSSQPFLIYTTSGQENNHLTLS